MKILVVIHEFLPYNYGGTGVYALNISREFVRLGHEVRFFTTYHDKSEKEYNVRKYEIEGIPVYSVNQNYIEVKDFKSLNYNTVMEGHFRKAR